MTIPMISGAKKIIPKAVLSFIKKKVPEFIYDRIGKVADTKIELSLNDEKVRRDFERNIRHDVTKLREEIKNLDAVVAQCLCVFDEVVNRLTFPTDTGLININGNVTITNNYYFTDIQINNSVNITERALKILVDDITEKMYIVEESLPFDYITPIEATVEVDYTCSKFPEGEDFISIFERFNRLAKKADRKLARIREDSDE